MRSTVNTAICVGAPTSGSSGPTGRKRDAVAVARRRRRSAQAWNSARVHSKRWSLWRKLPGRQRLEPHVVLGVRRRQRRRCPAARTRTARARTRASRGGSRCSITSTTAAASKPCEPRVAVDQRAVEQADALALLRRQPVELEARSAQLERAVRHVDARRSPRTAARRAARAAACPRRSRGRARAARPTPSAPRARRRAAARSG